MINANISIHQFINFCLKNVAKADNFIFRNFSRFFLLFTPGNVSQTEDGWFQPLNLSLNLFFCIQFCRSMLPLIKEVLFIMQQAD